MQAGQRGKCGSGRLRGVGFVIVVLAGSAGAGVAAAALGPQTAPLPLSPSPAARLALAPPAAPRGNRLPVAKPKPAPRKAAASLPAAPPLPPRQVDFDLAFGTFPKAVAQRWTLLHRDGAPSFQTVSFDDVQVPRHIVETILRAAAVTGADPVYLMALADTESRFDPAARARTSSATGLFQFVDDTWLKAINAFGAEYGLADLAAEITMIGGRPVIRDDAARREILALRHQPYLSALMAGELAKRDGKALEAVIGRQPSDAEAYLAHFFGITNAEQFVTLLEHTPKRRASAEFPAAASANRNLFYSRKGRRARALSITQVFKKIDGMIKRRVARYQDLEQPDAASAFAAPQSF
jgi:hypothetical protein